MEGRGEHAGVASVVAQYAGVLANQGPLGVAIACLSLVPLADDQVSFGGFRRVGGGGTRESGLCNDAICRTAGQPGFIACFHVPVADDQVSGFSFE